MLDEHVGEPLARQHFARLGDGVQSVNHSRIAGKVDRLLGRVHRKWLYVHARELLSAIEELASSGDVLEVRTQDRCDRLAIAVNDSRQPRASWLSTAASGDGGEAATVLACDSSNAAKANSGTNEARRTCFMIIS